MADEVGIYDMIIEELLDRQKLVKEELRSRFKGVKPFRQEPVSRKDMILDLDEMMQKEAYLRQNFGDDAFDETITTIQSKIRGGVNYG